MSNSTNVHEFEPIHKAHAIEQVSLGVSFDQELDDDGLKAAKDAIGNPEELPGRAEMRGFSLMIGAPTSMSPVAPSVAGHGFTKTRGDGTIESELQIQKSVIIFRTTAYTRWANLWTQAKTYFDAVLSIYLSKVRVTQVNLGYVDKFVATTAPDLCHPQEILRENSPHLTPGVLRSQNLWHCHTGAFDRVDEYVKRLTNVQVEYVSERRNEQDRGVVVIRTVLMDMYNQPGYTPFQLQPEATVHSVYVAFERLHALGKGVLRNIITDEMARRIALEA